MKELKRHLNIVQSFNRDKQKIVSDMKTKAVKGPRQGDAAGGAIYLYKTTMVLVNPITGEDIPGTKWDVTFNKTTDFPARIRDRLLSEPKKDYHCFRLALDSNSQGYRTVGPLSNSFRAGGKLKDLADLVNKDLGANLYNELDFVSRNLALDPKSFGFNDINTLWKLAPRHLGWENMDYCGEALPEKIDVPSAPPPGSGKPEGGKPKPDPVAAAAAGAMDASRDGPLPSGANQLALDTAE